MANRYIDNTKETGTLTGANWQFTNASTTVTETGTAGNAVAELSAGDYVRTNAGTQWYKVASVTDDDNFEITPAFQQANNTDTGKYNSEDGTVIAQAFCHPHQYTTDEVRAAGDIGKLRANQTHVCAGVNITIDESGSVNSYITLKGCDSVDDPFSDASDVQPIISFESSSGYEYNHLACASRHYWKFENFAVTGALATAGAIYLNTANSIIIENCKIYNNGTTTGKRGIYPVACQDILVKDCIFDNNYGTSIYVTQTSMRLEGCNLDGDTVGGGNGTAVGLSLVLGSVAMKNCIFGGTDGHDTADISIGVAALVLGRNVKLNSGTEVAVITSPGSYIQLEDDEQTHEAYRGWYFAGNIEKSAVVERSGAGGTAWSMLGEPNSNCGSERPIYILGNWLRGIPIYLDGTEQTITIYAYADSTGGGWTPNASEFYIEIEHYEGAADWQVDVSSDAFAAEDQWESFAITLTPGAAGVAYLRAVLKDYAAGGKIYIDPKPVIS